MSTKTDFRVRVIEDYRAEYPDPIQVNAGDEVTVDPDKKTDIAGWIWCTNRAGKSGWVPVDYLERRGDWGRMLYDYSAIELTIQVGEILTVLKAESSFYWVTDQDNRQGWVPIANVEPYGP